MELVFELKKGTSKGGNKYFYLYNEDLNKRIFLNDLELKVLYLLHDKENIDLDEDE